MTLALIWLTGAAVTLLVDALIHRAVQRAGLMPQPYRWVGAIIIIGLFWPGVALLIAVRFARGYWEGRQG